MENLCFHLDSMFNLAFISYFYAVVIRIIQMFQPKDAMLSNSRCRDVILSNSRCNAITLAACDPITRLKMLEVTLFIS